jgi:hypothetical protein
MVNWNKLRAFGIVYGHLVMYIHSNNLVYFPRFGILNKETSGIPGVLQCGHSAFRAFG